MILRVSSQLVLEAPDDVMSLSFNPEDPMLLAAGCFNGQIALWDLRKYAKKIEAAADISGTKVGHTLLSLFAFTTSHRAIMM